jgi:hypothetical protein
MGAHLVTQALAHWTHLSDRAFRVLVRMAVTALDKPQNGNPANIYRGGRELLAMSLRSDKGTERTRNRAVAKAVAELTEAGAIEHIVTGWAGQNAAYRLTLTRVRAVAGTRSEDAGMGGSTDHPLDDPPEERMGGLRDHPVGGPTDHPMGGLCGTKRVVSETTPRSKRSYLEELDEEEGVELRTTSHPPRAVDAAEEPANVVVELFPGASRWSTRGQENIAAAQARVAARRAAHLAAKEAT